MHITSNEKVKGCPAIEIIPTERTLIQPLCSYIPLIVRKTKIIFESQIKETTYIEVADISDKLNERQKNALYSAQKNGFITRKEYMDINSVSNKTAYNDLKYMAGKRLVTIVGRGVKYMIQSND